MDGKIYSHEFIKYLRISDKKSLQFHPILSGEGLITDNMQNETGEVVDLYIPRKCSATNNIIAAKDHASVQTSVAEVDEEGRMTGSFKYFAFCGNVRKQAEVDDALVNLALMEGLVPKNYNA